MTQKNKIIAFVLCGIALLVLPLILQHFGNAWVRIADIALLYVMLALGLNIVVGYAGLLDLGYVAFFAVGAYLYGLLASPHLTENFAWFAAMFPDGMHLSLWLVIPLAAGGLFILSMLQYDEWRFIAPACLIFYGLALVNASKYTLTDIRYLGYCEIVIGILNMQWIGHGLYFWALGFGVMHIIYGIIMWWKYERKS